MVAVKVTVKAPLCVGVPDSTLWVKVTPVGRVPLSVTEGVGVPVAVTTKLFELPSAKVVLEAEVMVGGASTVNVKDWVAFEPTPLEAVTVMG